MSFQSPVEVPGVSNMDFLRMACNARRAALGIPELGPLEVLLLLFEEKPKDPKYFFTAQIAVSSGYFCKRCWSYPCKTIIRYLSFYMDRSSLFSLFFGVLSKCISENNLPLWAFREIKNLGILEFFPCISFVLRQ